MTTKPLYEYLQSTLRIINKSFLPGPDLEGFSSGFTKLDYALGGINREWGKNQTIVSEDESILLSFTASGKYEIMRWILSCGKDAIAIEPPELVKMVKEEHEGIIARYN